MTIFPKRRERWNIVDVASGIILGAIGIAVVLAGLWSLASSERYLQPLGIEYRLEADGNWWVYFERLTPRGAVNGMWATEITNTRTGQSCLANGTAPYEVINGTSLRGRPANIARFALHPRHRPCMEAGVPMTVDMTVYVLLWDVIPLRPTHLITQTE